jgi:hypothetical protein|tara:strand:+ start:798 stop:1052 length:255 start_codon:yes stop_codon:yes gene_type:complete
VHVGIYNSVFFCCANFLDLRNSHHDEDQHCKCDEHGIYCLKVGVVMGHHHDPTTHNAYALNDHGNGTKYEYAHDTGKEATEPLE